MKEIYDEAGALLGAVTKKFEDVLNFHNSMIANKIKFVEKSMSELDKKKRSLDEEISVLTKQEQQVLQSISKKGALEDFQKLNTQLSELKERRGEKGGLLAEICRVEEQVNLTKDSLEAVSKSLLEYQGRLDNALEKFNLYYTDYAKKLYDEEYVLSYDNEDNGTYVFSVTAMKGAVGSGKKKGQITAFDLAYLRYLEEKKASTCRFQLNDRMEEVSINQLKTAFDIANKIDGQFIVAILKDKIASLGDQFISDNQILKLTQEEKFFNI
ncbi:MAG: DUF2326 domain-containing protein [Bacteriovoracaceae bacterium]|nr:DUF2326 domain-containing protein [Bacteriovoracaceae bacterium]